MIDTNNDTGTKAEAQKEKKVMKSGPKTPPKKPVLHDRKCINKGCKGGNQEIIGESMFRGMRMVTLRCFACLQQRSIMANDKGQMKKTQVSLPTVYTISLSALEEMLKPTYNTEDLPTPSKS